MKYPMEYWTGRMSGVLGAMATIEAVPKHLRDKCAEIVSEFEEDYNEEEVSR